MRIVFENGQAFEYLPSAREIYHVQSGGRVWRKFPIVATIEDAKAAFVDNAKFYREWEEIEIDEEGNSSTITRRLLLQDYVVAGDIVDTRDGNVIVYMGKKTEAEKLQEKETF